MHHYFTFASVAPASTQTPPVVPPPAIPRGNVFARFARHLIETGARARTRRHLNDLPDHVRVDIGLPPRWNDEGVVKHPFIRSALSGRT